MSKWGPVALSKRAVPGLFCYHFTYCFSIWKTCAHMYVTKKWTHSHDIVKPSIHGFRSYHIYYSKWRICCWQCFQKFHVRSPPFAETSLLLRATRQLILGSGFFNQSFQIKKGKNIIIKWSGSTYFSNKDVPDISAWMCFMTWKLIWNPSSFKTCQKNDVKTYTVMVSFSLSRLHHPKTPPFRDTWGMNTYGEMAQKSLYI